MTTSTLITRDGTCLAVEENGRADAPVTVVLVHGWTLDRTSWQRVAHGLAGRSGDVRVLRFDLRGHGHSGQAAEGGTTIDVLADDLAEVITQLVPSGPVVIGGHSMGGMTTMALADRHPDLFAARVVAVALVATACDGLSGATLGLPGPVGRGVVAGQQRFGRAMHKRGARRMTRYPSVMRPALRWMLFGRAPEPADVRQTAAVIAGCSPLTLTGYLDDLFLHNRRAALAAFRALPVVVLAGSQDRLTPPRHAQAIAGELPQAELVLFPGAGHMLPLERSVQVTERLARLVSVVTPAEV
ncbi:pimeloyl-ACP methyl ester carboxylesterase [Crossiella equi]|uniref:Pimeloyl-ACP methyl ester carboxylesterase n=1 Tax=Crossiella equi TaxID=130796 RepID=A0ABS5AJ10_9PSEU|nr:alpha/beta hydrolase [Crossiella equi]MBP2476536.1 pimeloyl-ACP methyl ester carboxylesterase [Crossiella equi]